MKVTNLVYAMVKLNYLKMEDPEEEIYFIYLFIYLFLFFFGGVGKLRCRNIHSGPFLRSWVEKSPVESAVMVDLIVLKCHQKKRSFSPSSR